MNSMRARPTPRTGSRCQRKAASGLATFMRIEVRVSGRSSRSMSLVSNSSSPFHTVPSGPSAQETVTAMPSSSRSVASPAPTIAGMPSSRLTIAAWAVRPPWSVTTAAARAMIGPQSGSVTGATSTSPSSNASASDGWCRTRTVPVAIASPTASPVTRASDRSRSSYVRSPPSRRDCTVSGRACTMKSSPLPASLAHSTSMGRS